MDKRIGAQLYTVRELIKTEEELDIVLGKLSEMGYKVVQFSNLDDYSPEAVRDLCKKHNMEIACFHGCFDDFRDRSEYVINYMKTVGCNIIGVSYITPEYRKSFDTIKEFVDSLNGFYDLFRKHGITLAHHNHGYDLAKYDGVRAMDYMLEKGKFSFVADVYWIAYAGFDPVEYIKKMGDRCCILHYKDLYVNNGNQIKYAPVGEGNLNWDRIIKVSDKALFALVEQDTCERDPLDCMKSSYEYLRNKGFN